MNQETSTWTYFKGGQSLADHLKLLKVTNCSIVTIVPLTYQIGGGLDLMNKESTLTEALIVYEKK